MCVSLNEMFPRSFAAWPLHRRLLEELKEAEKGRWSLTPSLAAAPGPIFQADNERQAFFCKRCSGEDEVPVGRIIARHRIGTKTKRRWPCCPPASTAGCRRKGSIGH